MTAGITTNGPTAAGGDARHADDFRRLRHARAQHEGFPVGKYLQPPPMLFTRDGHNVFLGDMYRGSAAFLICSGPSLTTQDLSRLQERGVLTCAVNNAATIHRPNLWVSADDPGNFSEAIWYDPAIWKFVPLCHMEKTFTERNEHDQLVPSQRLVGDMPAVFGFRRNEDFQPKQWLYEDTFNWGNHSNRTDESGNKGSRSIMYVALRLLFYLGVRRVYLLGCDFRMRRGEQNYAFEQERSDSSVAGNNSSYRIMNARFGRLRPYFEKAGFEVFNCTPGSGLKTFQYVPYDEAINYSTSMMPRKIITAGMYDRQASTEAFGQLAIPPVPEKVVRVQPKDIPSSAIASGLPDFTLVTCIDQHNLDAFRCTWATWMRFRPEIATMPCVLVHDEKMRIEEQNLEFLNEHNQITIISGRPDRTRAGRDAWSLVYLQVAASHVKTPWYLKLEPEAVAIARSQWLRPEWFLEEADRPAPAFASNPWGYTRPANSIEKLDQWASSVDELAGYPALQLQHDQTSDRILHETISSWFFWGRTDWTREVAGYVNGQLPCDSFDTYMYYCAVRRGAPFVRYKMKQLGWEHHFGANRSIHALCKKVLAAQ